MKKILTFLLIFAAALCLCGGLSACDFGGNNLGPSIQEAPDLGPDDEPPPRRGK